MVVKIADNILSPLGVTTAENYQALKSGKSALRLHDCRGAVTQPFYASIIDEDKLRVGESYTKFERMCIQSVETALAQTDLDAASDRVLFILSTTKGNVHRIGTEESPLLGDSAKVVAGYFGNTVPPMVVSNACISGVCAQIAAMRALELGLYDYVVVVGADVQSDFIITGFQSLKALSDEACKPFDAHRKGLNLGEAAATIIYTKSDKAPEARWNMVCGAVRNDANHISGPSRTGEGSWLVLRDVMRHLDIDELAFVNAHGTATLYNDEMESIAISRAGLADIPVNSLKGYYGHTMGAAGIVETLISMNAVDDNTVLATRNYEQLGVSHALQVSNRNGSTEKKAFIKLISGFGGCNAAAGFRRIDK
ncbi:MAG: beta-ketoacyl synthase [Bacteroidales bacterium]|nr:beta-ketoacyl synthase [Bacteroidales bacterium]